MHISGWASGKDLLYFSVTDPLQPEVDKVYNFLAPLGLAANLTGDDLGRAGERSARPRLRLLHDSSARTAGGTRATRRSINSRSFNRYAEWLRLWNVKAQKRWVLWQIPLGNSNHLNVYNNGGGAQGYKDNRPEYFFGATAPRTCEKFARRRRHRPAVRRGRGGQSSYTNDIYTDGQLFMKSRAGAFLNAGGVPID